jgi:hypothetical protein
MSEKELNENASKEAALQKHIELQIEDRELIEIKVSGGLEAIMEAIRTRSGTEEILILFERDGDELDEKHGSRHSISVVAHRCKEIHITVRFEHRSEERSFKPSATINRVLQWAVKEFKLDATQRSKANLILPGTETPLLKDDVLAQYSKFPHCKLMLDLTLKDFTNGHG